MLQQNSLRFYKVRKVLDRHNLAGDLTSDAQRACRMLPTSWTCAPVSLLLPSHLRLSAA